MNEPPKITPMGAVNWIGLGTLYMREVRRFMKVYTQTLVAPDLAHIECPQPDPVDGAHGCYFRGFVHAWIYKPGA
jgi:hypothetical protein